MQNSKVTFDQVPAIVWEMRNELQEVKELLTKQSKQSQPGTINYLTRDQVADRCKVSLPTLHTWTMEGILKAYRIGRRVYIKNMKWTKLYLRL